MNSPQKVCPVCSRLSAIGAPSCPCGHQFRTQFAPPVVAAPIPAFQIRKKATLWPLWFLLLFPLCVGLMVFGSKRDGNYTTVWYRCYQDTKERYGDDISIPSDIQIKKVSSSPLIYIAEGGFMGHYSHYYLFADKVEIDNGLATCLEYGAQAQN